MNVLSILGSGPIIAILGHILTAGLTYAYAKGYVAPDTVGSVATVLGGLLNVAASGARSTAPAAAKQAAKANLAVVTSTGQPVSTPTAWGKPVN